MTPAFFCKDCGRDEGRFCCSVNLLTCHEAIESALGKDDASMFGKELHPYFEKASGSCWSNLKYTERDCLTEIMLSKRLPHLVGMRALTSLDDIPDDTVFKVIKLLPGESLEDISSISKRVKRGRGTEYLGEVRLGDFKFIETQISEKPLYQFADGFFKVSDDLEISGLPTPQVPRLGNAIEIFLPIFQTCFDPSAPTDEEIAADFFRELIGDEPEPLKVKRVKPAVGKASRQSGVNGVFWEDSSKAWAANWCEGGKRKQHYFPVAKFGETEALRLAIELRTKMEKSGKASIAPVAQRQSEHVGVTWHASRHGWVSSVFKSGKRINKFFSIKKYGDDEALRLAVAWREEQLKV